jgi:hypothetical protein
LREAETLAEEGYEWADIASLWIDCLGPDGIADAVRCLEKSYVFPNFYSALLSSVEVWLKISACDPAYLERAWQGMEAAVDNMYEGGPDLVAACHCARTWIMFPDIRAHQEAWNLLGYAEKLYTEEERDVFGSHLSSGYTR